MKDAGITFNLTPEVEASRYLDKNTYYFRIKAYAKNYEKYSTEEKQGLYINLDFAYLIDLSEIDFKLRELSLKMTTTLEHYLKVKLLSDFNTTHEDGYEIVQELFKMQPDLKEKIEDEEKNNTSTCNELIAKYKNDWAIWNIVEVLSLGRLVDLYALFYNRNTFQESYKNMLHPVRTLRNASAHGNCLINRLRPPFSRNITPSYDLRAELMQEVGLSKKSIDKKLVHPIIHDFSTVLYLYSRIVPDPERSSIFLEINDLFSSRMLLNRDYYFKHDAIESSYRFVKQIVDYYCSPKA
jgi:hypothetical protein